MSYSFQFNVNLQTEAEFIQLTLKEIQLRKAGRAGEMKLEV